VGRFDSRFWVVGAAAAGESDSLMVDGKDGL
jgi:hypothetical protein